MAMIMIEFWKDVCSPSWQPHHRFLDKLQDFQKMFLNHLLLFLLLLNFVQLLYVQRLLIILYLRILLILILLFISAHLNLIFIPFLLLFIGVLIFF